MRNRDGTSVRYIEVKGRAGEGDVVLTEHEWTMARRLEADYWMYVVTEAREPATVHVHPIQGPASKLQPEPQQQQQIVRYRVKMETGSRRLNGDWREAGECRGISPRCS